MSNTPDVKVTIAQTMLQLAPPLIRESILGDSEFRQECGFTTEDILTLGNPGFSIQSSELFDAVRKALKSTAKFEITDINGRKWELRNEAKTEEPPKIVFSSEKQQFSFLNFAVFSQNTEIRLGFLDQIATDVNLPITSQNTWRNILTERALKEDEFEPFHSDLRDTPVHLARSIHKEILSGKSSISSLVPSSRRYFVRLVGTYDGSASIRDYAKGVGKQLIKQLSAWQPWEGYLFSLFLSSHSTLTTEIDIEYLEQKDIVRAYDFIEKYGDILSRLGAIEVGLRILPENPEIEPCIIRLIQQIRDDDLDGKRSEFKLFSALFILVDGELSRTRLLAAEPPFYRRLASLSHAALIHRQIFTSVADYDSFSDWALANRGQQYLMQSLCDMRLEPRWIPNYGAASQMKSNFFSRIIVAAKNFEKNIHGSKLHDMVFTEHNSLYSLGEFPGLYLPGPLEGDEAAANVLPSELSEAIEEQLNTDDIEASSFITLVNSAMIFQIDSRRAEWAAKALDISNHRLANVQDKSQLLSILNGLATAASVARHPTLADELRILMRNYRSDAQYGFTIEEELTICLLAAPSRTDLTDWRNFVGAWLSELAFGELNDNDAEILRSHLKCLCHSVPELWLSCGKADAALVAFCGR